MERAKQVGLAACQAADPGGALKGPLFSKRGHILPAESLYSPRALSFLGYPSVTSPSSQCPTSPACDPPHAG